MRVVGVYDGFFAADEKEMRAFCDVYIKSFEELLWKDVYKRQASLMFSMDRYASYKQDWGAFYEAGGLVVADRYTTSNAVHQASKLLPGERKAFLDWLFDTEYRLLGLPKPDLVIYLDCLLYTSFSPLA